MHRTSLIQENNIEEYSFSQSIRSGLTYIDHNDYVARTRYFFNYPAHFEKMFDGPLFQRISGWFERHLAAISCKSRERMNASLLQICQIIKTCY